MLSYFIFRICKPVLIVSLFLTDSSFGCARWPGKRKRPANMTPLVYKQHVPNAAEHTLGASGVSEGKIKKGDESFTSLVTNNNPNIIFKDEEGDGSDMIMSQVSILFCF